MGDIDRIFVSPKGGTHYGALFSLFYSNNKICRKEKM